MTRAQMIRYDRRARLAEMRRQQIRETILAAILVIGILLVFGLAGTMDYEDEQRDLAFWAERGVTIQRW